MPAVAATAESGHPGYRPTPECDWPATPGHKFPRQPGGAGARRVRGQAAQPAGAPAGDSDLCHAHVSRPTPATRRTVHLHGLPGMTWRSFR